MKTATDVTASSWSANCPCGGGLMDPKSGSFQLTADARVSDGRHGGVCEDCGEEVVIKRTTAVLS